jgi:hypothetical protein
MNQGTSDTGSPSEPGTPRDAVQIGGDVAALTERRIQHAIYRWRRSSSQIVMPNFTPHGWAECDVWAVTKAGYTHEFEIKLTRSDFLADSRKVGKHVRLRKCRSLTYLPVCFWYVFAAKAWKRIAESEVPEYAGIIVASSADDRRIALATERKAPRLHSNKTEERVIQQAHTSCYYRYWNEHRRVLELSLEVSA